MSENGCVKCCYISPTIDYVEQAFAFAVKAKYRAIGDGAGHSLSVAQ